MQHRLFAGDEAADGGRGPNAGGLRPDGRLYGANVGGESGATGRSDGEMAGLWDRPRRRFILIAYAFSWVFWIAAWAAAIASDNGDLLFNEALVFDVLFEGGQSATLVWLSLLSLLGVYGPLIGGIVATRSDPAIRPGDLRTRLLRVGVGSRVYGQVAGILLVVTVPTLIATAVIADPADNAPGAGELVAFLLVFFGVQLVTSGTEEVGWRGYLTHTLLPGRSYWDTGWAVGPVWAVWHFPVVIQIFLAQDFEPAAIVGSLAGFTIGIVAMAILQAWFYERTHSVFLAIIIHAAFNTVPLTIVLLFEGSPAAVLANLLLWAVVIFIKSRTDRAARLSEANPTK
jgi:membrane protease YdiL (CAAX protease family)